MKKGKNLNFIHVSYIASILLLSSNNLLAEEKTASKVYTLDGVEAVYEQQENSIYAKEPVNAVSTNTLTKKALDNIGGPAQSNYYKALDILPGVNVQTADMSGIGAQNIKVRGKSSFHIGRTIEDLPLTGVVGANAIGGGELFDMENLSELNLYKGAVASDKGFSLSTSGGVINANLLSPSKDFGGSIKQSFGSNNFLRTFGRIDSGKLSTDSSFFLSFSNTSGDKWKGEGGSPDGKQNFNLGYTQNFGDKVTANIYAAYGKIKTHDYRSLSFAQASDLDTYYKYDFNSKLTSGATDNDKYYDYNRQEYESYAIIADIKAVIADEAILTIKPHYWAEDGYRLYSAGSNKITRWDIEHEQFGLLTKIDAYIGGTEFTIGYDFLNMEAPPPPVYRKDSLLDASGNQLPSYYSTLSKQTDNLLHTFFVSGVKSIDNFTFSGGLKYLIWKTADLQYYENINTLPGTLSYDEAISAATPAVRENVKSQTYHRVLPNISLDYKFDNLLSSALQYSKTYGRPDWGPQAVAYQKASVTYKANHTMQDMFDMLKPEMADNFELSMTYNNKNLHFKPVLFYSIYTDKELNIYDAEAGQRYNISSSEAHAYGAEAELSYQATPTLSLFCSPSYTISKYDSDTVISATQTVKTDGNQVPDIPKLLVKLGMTYETGDFFISPIVRYSDSRYGDAENTQKVDAYSVVDIHAGYNLKNVLSLKEVSLNASLLNVFDEKYIGIISNNDFSLNNTTSYMSGAPFAAVISLSAKF
ncbi:TonB-dependent receptor [Sulfurimonas sp.]|jgi:iron complex outermembrane receptor protein|uniref:TonB-dependent receptor n=1 Tax=Sulfurimonas sp. TaxID=2022749 RepID=UPI002A361DA0|nr:TonB-dependent receptor [Sulfurimonas sp.]MDY0123367.1 TonB-dependent receptor [Sulfurimonas sp.]